MNEIKLLGAALAVLLTGAYLSWTKEEKAGGRETKVTILDVSKDALEAIELVSNTSTVTVTMKKDDAGKLYPWFETNSQGKKRAFTGSDKFDKRKESFAPFQAARSLGRLTPEELEETGLKHPERKLTIRYAGKERIFDVGGRTNGARDHYVRVQGGEEVYLVESSVLGDLEFPDGQFMQRQLLTKEEQDVEKVVVLASGRTKTVLHRNRLSPESAFWASEEAPEEVNETIGNYVDKLMKMTVTEYLEDASKFQQALPVLEVKWLGEKDEHLGSMTLSKEGEGKESSYYALSETTRVPVKVSRFMAEQLERDLDTFFASQAGTSEPENKQEKKPSAPTSPATKGSKPAKIK